MTEKVNNSTLILQYVASRALPVSRSEIVSGTSLRLDQVRKSTNEMVRVGKLSLETDELGVPRYKAKTQVKVPAPANQEERPAWKINNDPTASSRNWISLVEEAEQRGFAKGYEEGAKASQRQAFEDGKEAVIDRLRALLS